jgi:hypothetical protein
MAPLYTITTTSCNVHIYKVANQALGWCQADNVISYMQDLIYSYLGGA